MLGLFGGPGFLVVCALIAVIAGAIAYLALTGNHGAGGSATIVLPGAGVPSAQGGATASPLQSMAAAPVAKELEVSVAIEEDLSPSELLTKYPPDPSAALPAGTADLPPWRRFCRGSAISGEARRVALVITGRGRYRPDTVRAITGAPPEASLSFDPKAQDLAGWIAAARAYGHEAFLDLPLDGTADGLAPTEKPDDNLRRLDAMLAQAPMIAGVAVRGGEAFLANGAALQPILKHLEAAGLATVGVPITAPLTVAADEVIAGAVPQDTVEQAIDSMMGLARHRGASLGLIDASSAASLFPAWQRALVGRDDISLVPASALIEQ
jgi:polysaccharide deacetylase 2 family uncharacterized protein YibQ